MKHDLHTHTVYCDGKNTAEEMILSAPDKGLERLGILAHSYVSFDDWYCMPTEKIGAFQDEVERLKDKYADRIEILCGIEQDVVSEYRVEGFDYIIGSNHYVCKNGAYIPADSTPERLMRGVKEQFDGDYYAYLEAYFDAVSKVVERTDCDIIAHFDLPCKFNTKHGLFDENDPRYIAAWQSAADKLLQTGKPFEINTGAISRG